MEHHTKEALIHVLREAGVEAPATATMRQLKSLYNQLPPSLQVLEVPGPDETLPSAVLTTGAAAPPSGVNPTDAPTDALPPRAAETEASPAEHTDAEHRVAIQLSTNLSLPPSEAQVPTEEIVSQLSSEFQAEATAAPPASHIVVAAANDDLDQQLERLRKQRKLLQLQREIELLTPPRAVTGSQTRLTDVSVIEAMVPKYTADEPYDVNKWFEDLEDAFAILQFDERLKFVACRRMVEGTAKLFVRTISLSQYVELRCAMVKEFGRKRTTQEIYAQLTARRLKPGESVRRYILEMQEIALKSSIPESELVDLIIDGIGDSSANISMLYSASSIHELKTLAERYERKRLRSAATPKTASLPPRMTNIAARPVAPAAANTAARPMVPLAAQPSELPRCFNCSKFGHYQSQCPLPKRPPNSCFKCASNEHVYRDCPKRATAAATIAAIDQSDEDAVMNSIESLQMVSVAFDSELDHSEFNKLLCLFDSGSNKCFIRASDAPVTFNTLKNEIHLRSIGNYPLRPLGIIEAHIKIANR